jgi:hypothetical protein
MVDRAGHSTSWLARYTAAQTCAVAPVPPDVAERAVGLQESVCRRVDEQRKSTMLRLLGALLYRAGRPAEALRALDDGIRRPGPESPDDDAYRALIHHDLGHTAEAREWLDRFRARFAAGPPSRDFWEALALESLRTEAEAKVLLDPAFPADVFARP